MEIAFTQPGEPVIEHTKTVCILISFLVRTSRELRDQLLNGCCVWTFSTPACLRNELER